MKKKTIIVNDKMQKRFRYVLTEPMGKNFDPEFKPEVTPKHMLELGVFGGKYMTDCRKEFPPDWFKKAIKKHCSIGATGCRPKQHQAVLHWAYDSRKI